MTDILWFARASLRRFLYSILVTAAATAGAAEQWQLGDAPIRDESQDASSWSYKLAPKIANTRDNVVSLYRSTYLPGNVVPLSWAGSVANCGPGTTNGEHQEAVTARINYFRALVNLPAVTLLAGAETTQVQAAALMMSANNALSHAPPPSWLCYSASGAIGAGNANIALGAQGVAAVDLYVDDPGDGNTAAGHRRWILFPPRSAMATGDVSGGNTPPRPANAVYVLGPSTTRPATPNGIAWPPAGFVPYQNLPGQSNRWSMSYPGADFTHASVAMTGPSGPLPVTFEALANGYGDNTIVFLPTGVAYTRPATDTMYQIVVSGIAGNGVPSTIQYVVTVIDPDAAAPPTVLLVNVIEFYDAGLDHYFITADPLEINALDTGHFVGWARTGYSFNAVVASALAPAGASPVCRFYGDPAAGLDSHFYSASSSECAEVGARYPQWIFESANVFQIFLPDQATGACPISTIPVYRAWNQRTDSNHRYTTDPAVQAQMVAKGYIAEGYGNPPVAMCAPQ